MINLGRKEDYPVETAKPADQKERIYYPGFHVSNIDLGIDEEDVGKTLIATVKLRINAASKHINKGDKGIKKTEDYDFDVLAIEMGKPKKRDKATEDSAQAVIEDELEGQLQKKEKE